MPTGRDDLQAIQGVPHFWDRVHSADTTLILLDYDGTLAPFHPDRFQAVPLPGIPETLEALHRPPEQVVALVSGRPVDEVLTLLDREGFAVAGTHGFELYVPGQPLEAWDLSDRQSQGLEQAEAIANDIAGSHLTERKIATVAVHTRPLSEERATALEATIRQAFEPLADGDQLELRAFNGGLELRAAGRDKGAAVKELIERFGPADLTVYIGDDDTDEDAFRALPANGIGIKVGTSGHQTAAEGRLESSQAVRALLQDWNRVTQR